MKYGVFAFLALQSATPSTAPSAAVTKPFTRVPLMKLLLLGVLFLLSLNATACPEFSPTSRYTEVAVPCNGMAPDFSQPVAVNQSGPNGGECRVATSKTEYFLVSGRQLYWHKGQQVMPVGTLLSVPSCYQTDTDGDYYSTWNAVRLAIRIL